MPISEQLERIARALAAPANLAESQFFATGQSLERAVGILERLVALCRGLLAELQSTDMIRARQDLSAAATHIDQFAGTQQAGAAALGDLANMTTTVERRISQMRDIGRVIDVLAMNASLAAATMGEAGGDFGVFAGEIRRAVALAQSNLAQIDDELTAAGKNLSAAHTSVVSFVERNAEALHAIPQRLTTNVAALAQHANLAGEAASAVAARSQDVVRDIANTIMALQLGDITRQRIEHMQAVALTVRQVMAPEPDGLFPNLSDAEQGALVAIGCRLLGEQLLDTANELDQAAGHVEGRLHGLADHAHQIGRLGQQAHAATDTGQNSFLTALTADVRQTQALFDALRVAHADADRRIASVLDTTNRLVGYLATIRSVEADIHIMGLNTTLKCSRLGAIGGALSVIAQEIRRCGNDTATQADAAATELQHLVSLAGELVDSKWARDHATIGTVAEKMMVALDHFGRTGPTLSEALAGLQQDSVAVADLLGTAVVDFTVQHDISEALRRIVTEVTAMANQVDSPATEVVEPASRLLALLSRDYTMARERDIHARYAPLPTDAPTAAAPVLAEPDLSDVLF